MIAMFAFSSLMPALLTCAAAWALAVWALKQRDPITRLVQSVTGTGEAGDSARTAPQCHDGRENS